MQPAGSCGLESSLRALCEAAGDRDRGVRAQVVLSLRELGGRRPEPVLAACHDYLGRRGRLEDEHRAAVLRGMADVAREAGQRVGELLARKVAAAARQELSGPEEALRGASLEALGDLLAALGRTFAQEVLEELQQGLGSPELPALRALARLVEGNPRGTVAQLPGILEAALPLLSRAQNDRAKAALASALGSFSRGILACQSEPTESAPGKEAFAKEMEAAYQVLFHDWLPRRDAGLRREVLSALGDVVRLLPPDRLREELPALLPALLACYRRQAEAQAVTRCLGRVLEAAVALGHEALEHQAEALLPPLHRQACGASGPSAELLSCFATLAQASPSQLLGFLSRQTAGSERGRLGALVVLRHLLGSRLGQLQSRRPALFSSLRPALSDSSRRVQRAALEVVEGLVTGGYLEGEVREQGEREGREAVLEFVVSQCGPAEAEETELRARAEEVLGRAVANEGLERLLWPSLLAYVTPVRYTGALAPLCRALGLLCSRRCQAGPEALTLQAGTGLPTAQALLVRLLAAASLPHEGGGRGAPALRLLLVLGPALHPALERSWRAELPDLAGFLERTPGDTFPQQQWEKSLLLLLFKSAEAVADASWSHRLAEELATLIGAWQAAPASPALRTLAPKERQFLFKCVGIVLQHSGSAELIDRHLRQMLHSVQPGEPAEREGAAIGVGLCAMAHLDETLARLEDLARPEASKKTTSFFGALMERLDGDAEKTKGTLILCYGYAALYAPGHLLLSRLESGILQAILSLSNTRLLGIKVESKDPTVRLSFVQAVTLVAKALLASRHRHTYHLAKKGELLAAMQGIIRAESQAPLRTPMRQLALAACAQLLKLGPPLNKAYVTELIKTGLDSVLGLPPEEEGAREEDGARQGLYGEALAALQGLLDEILLQDLSPEGLWAIFKHTEAWLASAKDHERERAVGVARRLTALYLKETGAQAGTEFGHLGAMVGRLTPRCADPVLGLRGQALASVCALFDVHLRHRGLGEGRPDEPLERLRAWGDQLDRCDHQRLLQALADLAAALSRHLPRGQVAPLLFALFEGLDEPFPSCSGAAAFVMNTVALSCGPALRGRGAEILRALAVRLQWSASDQIRLSVIRFIMLLAAQNTAEMVPCLLASPLPLDRNTQDIWSSLGGETPLATAAMELLLEALGPGEKTGTPPPARKLGPCSALDPLSAVCALRAMLSNPDSAEAASALYPRLLGSLLLQLNAGGGAEAAAGDARAQAAEALRAALTAGGTAGVADGLRESGGWAKLRSADGQPEGAALLARAMAAHARPRLVAVAHRLAGALPGASGSQRAALTSFLGELLAQPAATELHLTDTLVACLLGLLRDPVPHVRLLSIRGLANLADGDPRQVGPYCSQLLAALVEGAGDPDDPQDLVKLESLAGLARLLPLLPEGSAVAQLGSIAAALQPLFEEQSGRVRAEAFSLFGGLSRFGGGELGHVYAEQVRASLVSLALHAHDDEPGVSRACRWALGQAWPLLDSEGLSALLLPAGAPPDYWDFLRRLSEALVADLPAQIDGYLAAGIAFFQSLLPQMRGNAVAFVASLLRQLPRRYRQSVPSGNACADIIALLQDPVASVRAATAKALALLH
ncbi:maestro heat-like repeat-containing protein family member 1 [Mobula hypostoma]|uniref:maestro heat-like repeat-containing protein family member 1 n=1 Tax=Mobula hypostoma TaxID=723540 RepID=UPI002FC3DEAD